jgi:hypothetical protein
MVKNLRPGREAGKRRREGDPFGDLRRHMDGLQAVQKAGRRSSGSSVTRPPSSRATPTPTYRPATWPARPIGSRTLNPSCSPRCSRSDSGRAADKAPYEPKRWRKIACLVAHTPLTD